MNDISIGLVASKARADGFPERNLSARKDKSLRALVACIGAAGLVCRLDDRFSNQSVQVLVTEYEFHHLRIVE